MGNIKLILNYKIKLMIVLFLLFNTIYLCNSAVYPALPQIYINTDYDPPTKGKVIPVSTSYEFTNALKSANPGDIIEMKAGNTFTGPFTLPAKPEGSDWIYIRSSAYISLPKPCTRVSPNDSVFMPKIVVKAELTAILTASNAHHYRFVGIEFKPLPNSFVWNIIYIGNAEKTIETLPNNIIFDRCFIHGDPNAGSRRGVLMNGNYLSVIDSYISDCKEAGADSQALASYSATGPFKIVNNYLEGAGENVMFGGADPSIANAVMSDIEIRCNYFFKPLDWKNQKWTIKNLLEFKNAKRVLVEGNNFENCWVNGQVGFGLVLTPRNQNNTAPWSTIEDLTFRYNKFTNIEGGVNILGYDAPNKSQRASRILIQNNFFNVERVTPTGNNGRLFQILGGPTDIVIDHNTTFTYYSYITADGSPKTDNFVFTNNITTYGVYGFIGTGTANANTTLDKYFNPNWQISNNAVIGGTAKNFPLGNYFPIDTNAVGFVDFTKGDYHLSSKSPYSKSGTDGKDIGADIDALANASIYQCDDVADVADVDYKSEINIFPNPAKDYIEINFPVGVQLAVPNKIEIYDIMGVPYTPPKPLLIEREQLRLDVSGFVPGVYFVKVGDRVQRFIKL